MTRTKKSRFESFTRVPTYVHYQIADLVRRNTHSMRMSWLVEEKQSAPWHDIWSWLVAKEPLVAFRCGQERRPVGAGSISEPVPTQYVDSREPLSACGREICTSCLSPLPMFLTSPFSMYLNTQLSLLSLLFST